MTPQERLLADEPRLCRPPLPRVGIARMVQLAGLFDAVTAVAPPRHGRMMALMELVPAAGMLSARAATAVVGVLLIYLGAGLRRGKHRAWQLAVGAGRRCRSCCTWSRASTWPPPRSPAAAAGAADRGRAAGSTRCADRRNRWRALRALLGFVGAGFVLGFVEIAIRVNRLTAGPGVLGWAEHAGARPDRRHRAGALPVPAVGADRGQLHHRRVRPARLRGRPVVLLLRPGSAAPGAHRGRRPRRLRDAARPARRRPTRSATSRCAATSR